jgi:hypothetical protein
MDVETKTMRELGPSSESTARINPSSILPDGPIDASGRVVRGMRGHVVLPLEMTGHGDPCGRWRLLKC